MSVRSLAVLLTAALAVTACSRADDAAIDAAAPTTAPTTTAAAAEAPASTTVAPTTTVTSTTTMAPPAGLTVFASDTFEVEFTPNVVYGQALVRSDWGATETEVGDLTLDVYEPVRDGDAPMPAIVMIHGGGFTGGNSRAGALSTMAEDYASRGWVAFSINYRLAGDHGVLPDGYPVVAAQQNQANALYPACRDAKAAIRWIRANAEQYRIDPDAITAMGGSAGSFLALALGVTAEDDCVEEIALSDDPTLASTNLDQSSSVAVVIDHWGGDAILTMLDTLNPGTRYDNTDAPISIVHGTADSTVTIDNAERIVAAYEQTGVPFEYHPQVGAGHGIWGTTIDGAPLVENGFAFMVEHLELTVS